jgi:hypothetical protein
LNEVIGARKVCDHTIYELFFFFGGGVNLTICALAFYGALHALIFPSFFALAIWKIFLSSMIGGVN